MSLLKLLRRWLAQWERRGAFHILRVTLQLSKGQNTMEALDSTARWSKLDRGLCTCQCGRQPHLGLSTVQGHALQPLRAWIVRVAKLKFPPKWTVRTRLVPDLDRELQKINEGLASVSRKAVLKTVQRKSRWQHDRAPVLNWDSTLSEQRFRKWVSSWPAAVHISEVERLRSALKDYAVTPIDRLPNDGVILCPHHYQRSVMRMSRSLGDVSLQEEAEAYDQVFRFGQTLHHLPYTGLVSAHKHKYGFLKTWIKRRAFREGWPTDWDTLPVRPLVGYQNHHWGKLYGLAGRFCNHSSRYLEWGYGADRPVKVMHYARQFNKADSMLRPGRPPDDPLVFKSYDIKEFHTYIDVNETVLGIEEAVVQIRRTDVLLNYF